MPRQRLAVLAAALWWGSLTAIGAMAVPLLFSVLPNPSLAGYAAARLFSAQSWVSLVCTVALILCLRPRDGAGGMGVAGGAIGFVLAGALLALLLEHGVSPRIQARQNLAFWHSLGSAMFAAQWICALVVLWRTGSAGAPAEPGAGTS